MTFSEQEMERARRTVEAQLIKEAKSEPGRTGEDRRDANALVVPSGDAGAGTGPYPYSFQLAGYGSVTRRSRPGVVNIDPLTMSIHVPQRTEVKSPQKDLPEELRVDAFHGWRWARLVLGDDGWPALRSLIQQKSLAPEDVAQCMVASDRTTPIYGFFTTWSGRRSKPCNDAPGPRCVCGFYAVKERAQLKNENVVARERLYESLTVELDVELSGRLIVHQLGIRGQHQRLLGVHLPSRCTGAWLCPNRAEVVNFDARSPRIVCRPCAGKRRRVATPAQLSNALGVDVTWEAP